MLWCRIANMPCREAGGEQYKEKCPACTWHMEISGKAICKYEKYEKREDDQHERADFLTKRMNLPARREFVRACDELKTELKKTRMYKMITRLLDWLAEKI